MLTFAFLVFGAERPGPGASSVSLLQPLASGTNRPSHGPQSAYRPSCQIRLDEMCEAANAAAPCPSGGNATYFLDKGLAAALAELWQQQSVIEFGAGDGCYTGALRDQGVRAIGFDQLPGVEARTQGLVSYADLGKKQRVGCATYVLSLDTAERVPPKLEAKYLENLHRHNTRGIVLSWASGAKSHYTDVAGDEHVIERDPAVNYKDEADVVVRMAVLGYVHDFETSKKLREAAKHMPWLRNSLFYFDKAKPTKDCAD